MLYHTLFAFFHDRTECRNYPTGNAAEHAFGLMCHEESEANYEDAAVSIVLYVEGRYSNSYQREGA